MLPLSTKSVHMERMLEHKATSYKLFWLKAILEEYQLNQSLGISFDRLVCRMISEAWYPLVTYRLNFGHQDQLQRIVDHVAINYNLNSKTGKEAVLDFLCLNGSLQRDRVYQRRKAEFYNMVPYRLINTFFSDQTKGIKDQKKNRLIEALALEEDTCFYKITTDVSGDKSILIEDSWGQYIYTNYAVIRGWLDHKIVLYLQSKNPSVPNIPYKLDRAASRKLKRATDYWKSVNWDGRFNDIYTGKNMTQDNYVVHGGFSIDHYIPWTFVMHDELWITIPTFKHVNSAKNDRLPDADMFLDPYCIKHYEAFQLVKERYKDNEKKMAVLEDYLSLGGKLNSKEILNADTHVSREVFVDSMKQTIMPLYQIAYNQGFEVWDGHVQ